MKLSSVLLAVVAGVAAVMLVLLSLTVAYVARSYAPEKEYVVEVGQIDPKGMTTGGFSYSAATDLLVVYVNDDDEIRPVIVEMSKVKIELRTDGRSNYSVKVAEAPWDGTCHYAVILVPLEEDIEKFYEWIRAGKEQPEPPKKKRYEDAI